MMRYFLTAFLFWIFVPVYGQYYDSVSFVNAAWKTEKIDRNIKLRRYYFNNKSLFRSNENIGYIILKNKSKRHEFAIAAEPQQLRTVSDFADEKKALGAINGNFFDMKNGGAVDFTKVDGTVINISQKGKDEKPDFHQKAAVVIENGRLNIRKWDGLVNWEEWLKEPNVMLNGPLLLLNKKEEVLDSNSFNVNRHPRTAVGITRKGKVILLVADGRSANAAGMNLFELTKVMRWLGCVSAINFDGGGSSALWVKDKGVVNYPSDNGKWDHEGERKVANILYVKKRR